MVQWVVYVVHKTGGAAVFADTPEKAAEKARTLFAPWNVAGIWDITIPPKVSHTALEAAYRRQDEP